MSCHPLSVLFVAAAAAAPLAAQHPTPEFVDEQLPGAFSITERGEERWLTCRIVDGLTGLPIEGAEVLLLDEAANPIGGELPVAMRGEADEDGFVALRVDEAAPDYRRWYWLCARAEGYCQHTRMNAFDDCVVRLSPTVSLPVQVRDWRGRPVAGALVGMCGGCGHTPDLVHGTTGANGLVTLPDVDVHAGIADFYVVHPELGIGYLSPTWIPGRGPLVLDVGPGLVHDGVVVDHDGRPVAGAAVGLPAVHRGPWTRTRADGTFELCGLDQREDLFVHAGGRRYYFEVAANRGLRLQLPKVEAVGGRDELHVVDLPAEAALRGRARYEHEERLHLARERAWPRVPVRAIGLPEGCTVQLRTRTRRWDLDDAIAAGEPVALPDEEFVFVLAVDYQERIVAGDRAQAVRDGHVRLRYFAPTLVEGRVVDERGAPLRARAVVVDVRDLDAGGELAWQDCDGALSVPTSLTGVAMLRVRESSGAAERMVAVDLPPRGDDAFVDVGTIVLPVEPPHRLIGPGGATLPKARLRILRAGWCAMDEGWQFVADERGEVWLPDLRDGDAVLLAADRPAPADLGPATLVDLPTRCVVREPGGQAFELQTGELWFEVDADGENAYAVVADHAFALDGPTLVRGLPPGVVRVFLSAEGRRSAIVDVEVPAQGRGTVRAALPSR